jgi:beta-lactamase class A
MIRQISQVPVTRNGKKVEKAVSSILDGEPVRNREALANPEALDEIAWELPGVMGIAVIDFAGERVFGVNEALVFPQGSAIKVSVLVAMYVRQARGEMDVDRQVAIRTEDRVGGSGYIRHFGDGTSSLSLHDLAVMMITVSDNMATNMLIDRVGMENVTAIMAELGLPGTRLQRRMIRQEQSARGNENLSTPLEAATLMRRILECDLFAAEIRLQVGQVFLEPVETCWRPAEMGQRAVAASDAEHHAPMRQALDG